MILLSTKELVAQYKRVGPIYLNWVRIHVFLRKAGDKEQAGNYDRLAGGEI